MIVDYEVGVDQLELASALVGGCTAAEIEAAAQVTADGLLLDFGAGNSLLLEGLTSSAGLAGDISIIL